MKNTAIIEVTLDACEPTALVTDGDGKYKPTPDGVSLSFHPETAETGWPEVTVRGPRILVLTYVAENWGSDAADVILEDEDTFVTEIPAPRSGETHEVSLALIAVDAEQADEIKQADGADSDLIAETAYDAAFTAIHRELREASVECSGDVAPDEDAALRRAFELMVRSVLANRTNG